MGMSASRTRVHGAGRSSAADTSRTSVAEEPQVELEVKEVGCAGLFPKYDVDEGR
jgi:hypothetical protein